jgi:hypothetical protein
VINIGQILLDLSTVIFSFGTGVLFYKKLNWYCKWLFYHVAAYLTIEVFAVTVSLANGLVYNIFMPIETLLLLLAAFTYPKLKRIRTALFFLVGTFLLIYFADIFFIIGWKNFCYHAAIVQGLVLAITYMALVYFWFRQKGHNTEKIFVILSGSGMILYFACGIPYLGMMFYLQKLDPGMNSELFQKIVVQLAKLRYLLVGISFLVAGWRTKKEKSQAIQI